MPAPGSRAEPLVAGRDQHVDAERGRVEGDDACGLRGVEDRVAPTERASSTRPAGSRRCPVAYWTWLTQMTEVRWSTAAAIVSSENEAGSASAGASRTSAPVSRATRSQGWVTLGNSRSAETTFSPAPRLQPPRDLAGRLGRVGDDRDVVHARPREPRDRRARISPNCFSISSSTTESRAPRSPPSSSAACRTAPAPARSSPCSGIRLPRARGSRSAARGRGGRSRLRARRCVDLELQHVGRW